MYFHCHLQFFRPAAHSILMSPTFHIASLNRYTPNLNILDILNIMNILRQRMRNQSRYPYADFEYSLCIYYYKYSKAENAKSKSKK